MALVWSKKLSGQHYEVRSAGKTLRLYTNGIFHSQWNPNKRLSGHLWDLLSLPLLLKPDITECNRILMLGVGGGAAINCLSSILPSAKIEGVDLDSTHLHIAQKYFSCSGDNIQLFNDDAYNFVRKDTVKYDLVIDDIFSGSENDESDPRRAIEFNTDWLSKIDFRLNRKGVLVANFEDEKQAKKACSLARNSNFPSRYIFSSRLYENRICAFLKEQTTLRNFKKNLSDTLNLKEQKLIEDNFSIRRL
ncbi:MAG: spermidine synthase [Flavobacteriales bacterium]|jgi:spermidine synthase